MFVLFVLLDSSIMYLYKWYATDIGTEERAERGLQAGVLELLAEGQAALGRGEGLLARFVCF